MQLFNTWKIGPKAWCTILLFLLTSWQANAQIADSLILEEIVIEASHIAIPWLYQPVQATVIDSVLAARSGNRNIAGLLTSFSPAHIRSYGGGLSSVSVRGFDSRQTQFVWNGFTMNHSMIGTTDFALYPSHLMDNIRVVNGNSSSVFGSGSVAGTIITESPLPVNHASFSFQQGSWGQFGSTISGGFNNSKLRTGVVLSGFQAVNNYPYFDRIRQRESFRRNNQVENRHALIHAGFNKGDFQWDSAIWLGFHDYHVPGSVTVSNAQAVQTDQFVNIFQRAGYVSTLGFTELSGLIQTYDLDYVDPRNRINSESTQNRYQFRLKHQARVHSSIFLTGLAEGGNTVIKTNNYADNPKRKQFAAAIAAEILPWDFLRLYPSIRFDSYSDFGNATSGSLGVNVSTPISWLTLRSQISNSFSAPTLNDLYWRPGGNIDLIPEKSRTFEAGINAQKIVSFASLRFGATYFNTQFENGIRWFPGAGGVWSPINIAEMQSTGFEFELDAKMYLGDFFAQAYSSLTLLDATSPQRIDQTDQTTNKQVANVPASSFKITGVLGWKFFYTMASWNSIGERFTTDDHSSPLDPLSPYNVLDVHFGLNLKFNNISADINYSLLNVLDSEYEVIAWYPMPPKNYNLNVTLRFNY